MIEPIKPFKHLHRSKQVRFGLVGGLNTAIDFGVFFSLTFFGINTLAANTLSTSLGMGCSFLLNRKYTFASENTDKYRELLRFVGITVVGLWIIQPIVIYLVIQSNGPIYNVHNQQALKSLGKLVSIGVSLVWNYLWYNHYVFRRVEVKAENS